MSVTTTTKNALDAGQGIEGSDPSTNLPEGTQVMTILADPPATVEIAPTTLTYSPRSRSWGAEDEQPIPYQLTTPLGFAASPIDCTAAQDPETIQ